MTKTPLWALLVLCAPLSIQAHAQAIYQYKTANGQMFLTNIEQNQSGKDKFTQLSVTIYPDTKLHTKGEIPATYNPVTAATPSKSARKNAYDHLIRAAAARHGVDPALIKAIMHTESAFNPNARSPVGAMGLMQLMPATAREYGVKNAYDPAQNIEGGTKFLAWLLKRFDKLDHVIAAYNAGPGNVSKYKGIPPFRETQNYVKSVNSRYATLYRGDAKLSSSYLAHNSPTELTPTNPPSATRPVANGRVYITK